MADDKNCEVNLNQLILNELKNKSVLNSNELKGFNKNELHGILLSLESKGQITFEIKENKLKILTEIGENFKKNGSEEMNLFNEIQEDGTDISVLEKYTNGSKIAFKNKWIKMKDNKLFKNVKTIENDQISDLLNTFNDLNLMSEGEFEDLKKRKLVEIIKKNCYEIKKGENFGISEDFETELTSQMIEKNEFHSLSFKKYNFNSLGTFPSTGALHPLLRIREEFKRIFLEMGFSEMDTSRYVESSFWNFDSLFQPQNHPSRDAHDTFFIRSPARTVKFEQDYFEKVKDMHSNGGFGSIGHQSIWNPEEAKKNILRTHTTAVSARYLKDLAKDFKPSKFFSIDKVFRNESIDATHLAEFHQVEGLIAGYDLSLRDLMGFLRTFFEKLGLKNLKFKPAFNPYTEPSMEIFGYHTGLGKWIELGNSGIFRPEMLRPMGFDEDVCVIAWGLSLERPAMIKYGLNNIRDLVGHKVDFNFIKKSEFIYF
jgi:phenylalanyl-tRNA synthetase alpha chain